MARPYSINIVDGTGTQEILEGKYSVSANVSGYDNSTINPTSVEIVSGTSEYNFTVSANGTLTINVSDGQGTNIVGATFIRTDADGNEYGSVVTTDSEGNAVLNNVPYSAENAPTVYFKQLSSDGDHNFTTEVKSALLSVQAGVSNVINSKAETKTIKLTDENYEGLVVSSGTITLT